MKLPDSLAPLQDRRFAWYYAGRSISTVGSVVAPIALTFAVLDITDSASALGLVLAARTVPMVVFMLVGGVIADRLSRSMIMQVSHLLSAATQGAVAALLLTGQAEIWMIVCLEALNGTVSAFTFPAMQGVVPQVVPRSHLQQANALLAFSRNGLAIIGPTVGALLVVTVGSGWALAVDALTWVAAAWCMSRLHLPSAALESAESSTMWRDLVEGWSAFTSLTWVWVVVLAFGVLNAIHAGAWFTLGPVIAQDTIGRAAGLGAERRGCGAPGDGAAHAARAPASPGAHGHDRGLRTRPAPVHLGFVSVGGTVDGAGILERLRDRSVQYRLADRLSRAHSQRAAVAHCVVRRARLIRGHADRHDRLRTTGRGVWRA